MRSAGRVAWALLATAIASTSWAEEQSASGADDSAGELAKKLSNPIANLISVPIKYSWDTSIGPADADRSTYVVQPVIPFEISTDWNLITRTILPVYIDSQSPVPGGKSTSRKSRLPHSTELKNW